MTQTLFDQLPEPIQELFLLGVDAARGRQWPDYLAFGINAEHIPALLLIVRQFASFWYDDQYDDDQGLTPIHAWRALGQLRAKEAINPLIFLIHENEEYNSDWIGEEIPVVLGMIGPESISGLRAYLNTPEKGLWAAVTAAHSLEEVGKQHPESRADCIAALQHTLENFIENDETMNGFLISYLVDLQAVEAVPLVERAFASENVDISIMGDFEDFQIALGLLKERLTPPPKYHWVKDMERELEADRETQLLLEQLRGQMAEVGEKKDGETKKPRRRRRKKRRK